VIIKCSNPYTSGGVFLMQIGTDATSLASIGALNGAIVEIIPNVRVKLNLDTGTSPRGPLRWYFTKIETEAESQK